MRRFLKINDADNVAVVLVDDARPGESCEGVELREPVARGHKMALRHIAQGEAVVKYGYPIGHATRDIEPGEWVHSHNLATSLSDNLQYDYHPTPPPELSAPYCPTFNGYLRRNGHVGIRNDLWIIPTVGCVNAQAEAIAERVRRKCDLTGITDVRALTHPYGCSQLGDDHANTRAALASIIIHPNAGGVLVLGLGCENNQIDALRSQLGDYDTERVRFLVAQEVDDEIAEGVGICHELAALMRSDRRTTQPLAKLKVGLKCGGSDGLSGITANPLVGMLSDRLIACGATTVLTEVPEMFGAETILMNRAATRDIFDKIVLMINDFKDYFRSYGQPVYENPSPGNKAGGITTLEDKSLGCVQKGGTATVTDVLSYAQPSTKPGLNLLTAPGNDLVAATALALSGCQMVIFTTGRGTPFGTFVPTVKVSTNSQLAAKKSAWVDFDAGQLLRDDRTPDAVLDDLLATVVSIADGAPARNELASAKAISIFKSGVTL